MQHILQEARMRGLPELTSDVSRTAQGFYQKFGFRVVEQRSPVRGGIVIPNALMRLSCRVPDRCLNGPCH
jgi:putative acetyltransferase